MRVVSYTSFGAGFMSPMISRNRGIDSYPAWRENFFNAPATSERARALDFFERRDNDIGQLPTRPPRPREKHNRFLVGDSRQGLYDAARRPLEQVSFQMPERFNAAHSSEGAGGCERDFVVEVINH